MNVATTSPTIGTIAKKTVTWSIMLSVLMILSGMLAIVIPPVAGLAVTIFVGWLLIFSGVMHLVYGWQTRNAGGLLWELALGILYIVIGAYLLMNPVVGLVGLTLGLAAYLVVEAILEFVLAVRRRPMPGTGWLFVDSLITLVLAIMIWRTWPASTAWAIGLLVGISMLFSGISRLMISLAARSLVTKLD